MNNTVNPWNPMEDDHLDYADTFSQGFISPQSTTLQETDDLDYQPPFVKGKAVPIMPMFEDSPSDYSLASLGDTNAYEDLTTPPNYTDSAINTKKYVGPMDIQHHQQQRHSMLNTGSKQYNLLMNERNSKNQQQHTTQQPIYHPSALAYPSSGFPMSAPANIGYDFHLNARSPVNPSMGSPSKPTTINTDLSNLSQGHLSMTLPPQQQPPFNDLSQNLEDEYAMQVNLQAMMEKRRRRRESHNAVERRRRENINDRIHELGCLLPESMLDEITNGSPTASPGGNATTKPNKGAILRKSVDHIRILQHDVKRYQQQVKELELVLEQYNAVKHET